MKTELVGLDALELQGRLVLCRLDLNAPMQAGKITSDARLVASLPTLQRLMTAGARVAIAAHLGRPKAGAAAAESSLEPIGLRLSELLRCELAMADDCIGDGVRASLRNLRNGQALLLENLRRHPGEEASDPQFARQLGQGFDTYVNDAFGACHRAHASIVGVVPAMQQAAAGLLLQREVGALTGLREAPSAPFVALVGGAKVSDKIGVLEALMGRIDALCIGGAMAYTFLAAQKIAVGRSRVESGAENVAVEVLQRAKACGVRVLLPVDHVAGERFAADTPLHHVAQAALPADLLGLDIGPRTRSLFAAEVAAAKTIFWNGPLGAFELPGGAAGTAALIAAVKASPAYAVLGGGDLVAALEQNGGGEQIGHVSTGGGASLELLQRGTLPGLEALHTFARLQARDARRASDRQPRQEDDDFDF